MSWFCALKVNRTIFQSSLFSCPNAHNRFLQIGIYVCLSAFNKVKQLSLPFIPVLLPLFRYPRCMVPAFRFHRAMRSLGGCPAAGCAGPHTSQLCPCVPDPPIPQPVPDPSAQPLSPPGTRAEPILHPPTCSQGPLRRVCPSERQSRALSIPCHQHYGLHTAGLKQAEIHSSESFCCFLSRFCSAWGISHLAQQ